jgi:hypothetical protein
MIQYCHARKYQQIKVPKQLAELYTFFDAGSEMTVVAPRGGYTVAMEVFPGWVFDTLNLHTFFEKKVGIARCSDEDNFCKANGRSLASSRLKATKLTVILKSDDRVILADDNNNKYTLKKTEHGNIRFVEFHNA